MTETVTFINSVRKALVAAIGTILFALSQTHSDNPYVQTALAIATVLGVYGVANQGQTSGASR